MTMNECLAAWAMTSMRLTAQKNKWLGRQSKQPALRVLASGRSSIGS